MDLLLQREQTEIRNLRITSDIKTPGELLGKKCLIQHQSKKEPTYFM